MRNLCKKLLALSVILAVTLSLGALPAGAASAEAVSTEVEATLASDGMESGQPGDGIVAEEAANSGAGDSEPEPEQAGIVPDETETPEAADATGLETVLGGNFEMTFEVKDPFDLEDMEREPEVRQRAYNAAGFTGEGSHLYGDQLGEGSAARMVYDALKSAWLGKNPAGIEEQVTVSLGDKKLSMSTTASGVYDNKSYWDAQSKQKFELATQCAIDAFLYDFPDIFWMKFGAGGMRYGVSYTAVDDYSFDINTIFVVASLIDGASGYYAAVDDEIGVRSSQFASGADAAARLRNAHDYIAKKVDYGMVSMFGEPHTRTPYGTLFGDYIVCEGYARTFKLFCDRIGIPSVLVMGRAVQQTGSELHMWNAVKLNGKWYMIDITWDDRGGIRVAYDYFLTGQDTVISGRPSGYNKPGLTHIPDGVINSSAIRFIYPAIESAAYFTQPSGTDTGKSVSSGTSSGSSGSSGGGGGGGAASGSTGTFTMLVENKPMDVTLEAASAAVKDSVKAAKKSGAGTASVRMKNPGKMTFDILKEIVKAAGMPVTLVADSMSADGASVEVRMRLDPSKATGDIELAASVSGERAGKTKTNFTKWFKNAVQPVCLAQGKPFGQEVEFAVMLDPKLDKNNLKFYAYDGKTCILLANQSYTVDGNGYVRFLADPAGDIVISAGLLEKK